MRKMAICTGIGMAAFVVATAPAEAFKLHNRANWGQCMGVAANNMTNGTAIVSWQCDNTTNQNWSFAVAGDGKYRLTNGSNAGKCLSYWGWGDGAPMQIWDCETQNDLQYSRQKLGVEDVSKNVTNSSGTYACYYFREPLSQDVVGVSAGNVSNGQPAILWHVIAGHQDQYWCVEY